MLKFGISFSSTTSAMRWYFFDFGIMFYHSGPKYSHKNTKPDLEDNWVFIKKKKIQKTKQDSNTWKYVLHWNCFLYISNFITQFFINNKLNWLRVLSQTCQQWLTALLCMLLVFCYNGKWFNRAGFISNPLEDLYYYKLLLEWIIIVAMNMVEIDIKTLWRLNLMRSNRPLASGPVPDSRPMVRDPNIQTPASVDDPVWTTGFYPTLT